MVKKIFEMEKKVIMGRMPKGCDLLKELTNICKDMGIINGKLEGIGALSQATIGYYDQVKKEYVWKKINKPMEVLSLKGNISLKDDSPFVHAHVVLGGRDGDTLGGHLGEESLVFAFEYIIIPFSGGNFNRKFDEDTGLFLWR